jgi:hypothetical protein
MKISDEVSNLDSETHVLHRKKFGCYYHLEWVLKQGDIVKEVHKSDKMGLPVYWLRSIQLKNL